ncbi:MAG TPA: hypothetical protein VGP26_27430 [Actinophytocola sp.]|jgi:hypothetical protein|nr:hypothetical protein [Actinophytocola sp.]
MPELFQMDRVDRIIDILYGVATGRATITYRKLAFRIGTRPDVLGHPLEHVSRRAVERGEPMWSALVVSAETGTPGPGFFAFARRLRAEYRELPDAEILRLECDRCYAAALAARPA